MITGIALQAVMFLGLAAGATPPQPAGQVFCTKYFDGSPTSCVKITPNGMAVPAPVPPQMNDP